MEGSEAHRHHRTRGIFIIWIHFCGFTDAIETNASKIRVKSFGSWERPIGVK